VKASLPLPTSAAPLRTTARVVRLIGRDAMGLELENVGETESERRGEFLMPLIDMGMD
jgi:hypothetical protein